jgi:hypothetical protein
VRPIEGPAVNSLAQREEATPRQEWGRTLVEMDGLLGKGNRRKFRHTDKWQGVEVTLWGVVARKGFRNHGSAAELLYGRCSRTVWCLVTCQALASAALE